MAESLEEAKQEVRQLRAQLDQWAKAYYEQDAPVVEDHVYDEKYARLLELEAAYPELKSADSITQRVGGEVNSDLKRSTKALLILRSISSAFCCDPT